MTPSKYIKSQGLPSTKYVADKVGKPVQTINNWYHNNYALFEVVVAGVWLAWAAESQEPNLTEQLDANAEPLREYLKRVNWNQ